MPSSGSSPSPKRGATDHQPAPLLTCLGRVQDNSNSILRPAQSRPPTDGDRMIAILDGNFDLVTSTDGRVYGVRKINPQRALPHERAASPLIQAVSLVFQKCHGKWRSSTAAVAASEYATAKAAELSPRPVLVRSHFEPRRPRLLLDVCDPDDTLIEVTGDGVRQLTDLYKLTQPVTFRRPATAAELLWFAPDNRALTFDELWALVPVTDEDRALVLALLISAWMTGVPQPIVLLTGGEDSGKTATARFLLSLIDPVTNQRGGGLPADEREWKARAGKSRVVLVDNLSRITSEASDLLCRVASGGEAITRTLYTDDGAHTSDLLLPVWLTSIDPGVLRGDLASRIVPIELGPLSEQGRINELDLAMRQDLVRQQITGALLKLTSAVLRLWSDVDRKMLPHRMGDFAIVLRCIDIHLGTRGEERLREHSRSLAEDVVAADPVGQTILAMIKGALPGGAAQKAFTEPGITAAELLTILGNWHAVGNLDRSWPRTPRILSANLARIEAALLKSHGIRIERSRSIERSRDRLIRIVVPDPNGAGTTER